MSRPIHPSYPEIWASLPEIQSAVGQAGMWEPFLRLVEMLHRRELDLMAGSGREYATVVVAASNSHQDGKDRANFVCEGSNDHLTLTKAVNALVEVGGIKFGRVELLEGSYVGSGNMGVADAVAHISGQGSGTTSFQGIGLEGSGSISRVLLSHLDIIGSMAGLDSVSMFDCVVVGNISADAVTGHQSGITGDIAFTEGAGFWDSSILRTLSSDRLHGTVADGSNFTVQSCKFTAPMAVTALGALSLLDIGGLHEADSISGVDALLDLASFKSGRAIGVHFDADLRSKHIRLTNCENLEVRGRSGRINSLVALPQVQLVESGGVCHNNSLVGYHFEGNSERASGAGGTTHHVDIGSGVGGTKLAYNYYGGAATADYLDNGTNTVVLPDPGVTPTPLTDSDDAGLFWMSGGQNPSSASSTETADETLVWMQSSAPGPAGPTGSTGATGGGADEGLLWMISAASASASAADSTEVRKVKGADESLASSTTLQNDDVLLFPVGTGESWGYTMRVFYSGPSVDAKFAITAPAGSTGATALNGRDSAGASVFGALFGSFGTAIIRDMTSGVTHYVEITGSVTTAGTSGNVQLQWAQNGSNITPMVVSKHSTLIAHRLA